MKKKLYLAVASLLVTLSFLTSCDESEGIDRYADWGARNDAYLNFIVQQAESNIGEEPGQWKKIKSYLLDADYAGGTNGSINDYVYAYINSKGTGATPLYTDSVYVCFRGTLINGDLFDYTKTFIPQNCISADTLFKNKPDDSYGDVYQHIVYYPNMNFVTPSKYYLSTLNTGWVTALQKMKTGDYWTLYIPSHLAYKKNSNYNDATGVTIPGHSLLIFDIYLNKVIER